MSTSALLRALQDLGLAPLTGVPLARLGFWRVGGPAELYVEVPNADRLAKILSFGAPVMALGNGSNLLVSDRGVRGITVRLTGALRETSFHPKVGPLVWAGGGLANAVLLRRVEAAGLSGLGCLAGVPGTVGGAIRLNAGTALGEIGAVTMAVQLALPDGSIYFLTGSELQFRYRHATLPEGAIVAQAMLQLREDDGTERAAIAQHLARRKATQPLDLPSCGSVFKNPPGDFAGRLIEAVGLKGARRGAAQISEKHANFIVNHGEARASDVLALIRLARDTVYDVHGVVLEPEVHAAGDWEPDEWPLPPVPR